MKIIDPHIHFFDLMKGQYAWLKPNNPPNWPDKSTINHNFFEQDIKLGGDLFLESYVHIEAGFDNESPFKEIQWLEENTTMAFKSIAGINLLLPKEQFIEQVLLLKRFNSVVGVRDILDESAVDYLKSAQVIENLTLLAKHELIFELQMPLDNIQAATLLASLLTNTPTLQIIINHAGSPCNQSNSLNTEKVNNWEASIKVLSQFKHCFIKCSGFEMENREYSPLWQQSIISHCVNAFGIERVMLASNFPLCLFSTTYQNYWHNLIACSHFNEDEFAQLCYFNAKNIYQL